MIGGRRRLSARVASWRLCSQVPADLEMRIHTEEMRTFGVEEELLLVDAETGAPVPAASRLLEGYQRTTGGPSALDAPVLTSEMQEEMVEIVSPPHGDLAGLLDDIR